MINKKDCKDRVLYRLDSRNLKFGVYKAAREGFIGLREKWGHIYLFTEFHWDNGEPFGTAKPLEELPEVLPESVPLEDILNGVYCQKCQQAVTFDAKREMGQKWAHDVPSACTAQDPYVRPNLSLRSWMENMEKKYGMGKVPHPEATKQGNSPVPPKG